MSLIIIIIGIIVLIGSVIALVNIFYFYYKGLFNNNNDIIRHVIAGIGAAILTPILLKNLIPNLPEYSNIEFLVISGFCFVAGFFSDRIINSVGKSILKVLKRKKTKVDNVISAVNENQQDLMISTENNSESIIVENEINNQNNIPYIDMKAQEEKIINSFSEKKKIRTAREIAVELDTNSIVVTTILEALYGQGKLKKLTCLNGNEHWALTQLGASLVNNEN